TPAHGTFSTAANVTLTGNVQNVSFGASTVFVNGTAATMNPDLTWSITLPLSAAAVVNPYNAEMRSVATAATLSRKRIVVIYGQSITDGNFSEDSVALRINDSGLNQLEPLIASGVAIDPATLLPVGTVVISNYCAIPGPFGTCLGRETATVANPPPTITGFAIDADSMTNFVTGDVDIYNLRIDLQLSGSGLAPSCGLRLTAANTQILGDYALQPDGVDPSNVDVNEIGNPVVSFTTFNQQFTSGLCNFPLIGSLIQAIIGNVEPTVRTGLQDYLKDPDGGGPLDAPVADAIEVALANISIAGPIGDTLQVNLDTPLFDVLEDNAGITLGSDTRFTATPVAGVPAPGECAQVPNAPNLAASYHVTEAFPSFGANTPGGSPYNLAISISTSAFNQLLKAQIECGLLQTSLTEIDIGAGLQPLTAGLLKVFMPTLSGFDSALPMRIDLKPTMAPFLTGNGGPGGEIGEIRIPQLIMEIHIDDGLHPGDTGLIIRGALDMTAGLGLSFVNGALTFSVSNVTGLTIAFLTNSITANEAQLTTVLNFLLPTALPALGDGLGAFPLPEFFGLLLDGVEVSRNGQFYTLFANLVPAP
ncbi:MAG: hypothetical protein NTZ61_12425, partial [Proteobacteria bacterium]|nr:hypothetical protein [Pseudomonadota bacterium]